MCFGYVRLKMNMECSLFAVGKDLSWRGEERGREGKVW